MEDYEVDSRLQLDSQTLSVTRGKEPSRGTERQLSPQELEQLIHGNRAIQASKSIENASAVNYDKSKPPAQQQQQTEHNVGHAGQGAIRNASVTGVMTQLKGQGEHHGDNKIKSVSQALHTKKDDKVREMRLKMEKQRRNRLKENHRKEVKGHFSARVLAEEGAAAATLGSWADRTPRRGEFGSFRELVRSTQGVGQALSPFGPS